MKVSITARRKLRSFKIIIIFGMYISMEGKGRAAAVLIFIARSAQLRIAIVTQINY